VAIASVEHILKSPRSAIIELLKAQGGHGGLTAESLAHALGVSKVSVRRHLNVLESDGLVNHQKVLHERGRPRFVFNLTEKAECLFPRTYDEFTRGLLRQVEKQFGKSGIEKVLQARADEQIEQLRSEMHGLEFEECLEVLARNISERGFHAETSAREDGSFALCQRNCPVETVATAYPEVCQQELRVYQEVLGGEVVRECWISDGSSFCAYRIVPPAESSSRSLRVLSNNLSRSQL